MDEKVLAWRKYPEPDGTSYFKDDLIRKSKVIELFDYCQILEAAIFANGWKFLFETYDLKGIIEVDKVSGWLDDEDIGEWISSIYSHSLIAGFNPRKMEFGKYSDKDGKFTNANGQTEQINWEEIRVKCSETNQTLKVSNNQYNVVAHFQRAKLFF